MRQVLDASFMIHLPVRTQVERFPAVMTGSRATIKGKAARTNGLERT
jgi:hypothetical protein